MVLNFFAEFFTWIMLFVILLNISQRKIPHSENKRRATILLAVLFLAVYVMLVLRMQWNLPSWTEWLLIAALFAVIIIFRKVFWPFRLHCTKCGKRLDYNHIIGYDENLCQDCFFEKYPEEAEKEMAERKRKATTLTELERALEAARAENEYLRCENAYLKKKDGAGGPSGAPSGDELSPKSWTVYQ